MTLKSDAKFEEKLIFCFKNEKTLVRFDLSTRNPQNDHFSPKHSKLRLWWDAFIQNRKCESLKFKQKKKKMTNKNNAKFEEELTCCFKIEILQSVSLTLQLAQHGILIFLKHYKTELKLRKTNAIFSLYS